MTKRISFLLVSFLLLAGAVATDAQSVSGSIGKGTVERGKATRGTVVLSIPGGLHVNSSKPASEYAIPTVVRLSGNGGVRVSGATYPRGKNRKFAFSETSINVYEGRVTFPFTVTVPASYKGKVIRITASVKYQACTDEVCYPPKTKNITLSAAVL
jgi:DsbC/DsbD-like thiol-disulfide interchange protein